MRISLNDMAKTVAEHGQSGDETAQQKLNDRVLLELQRRQRRYTERTSHNRSVNPTIRLGAQIDWQECREYFVMMAQQYRRVLIEQAKRRAAPQAVGEIGGDNYPAIDVIAIDAALITMESKDPSVAEAMLHRYFGGRDNAEIAAIMDLPQHRADVLVQFGKATLGQFTRFTSKK